MTTSLQIVESRLSSWLKASEARVRTAVDPADAARHRTAMAEFNRLLDIVSSAVVDLDAYREVAGKVKPAKRAKTVTAKAPTMNAVEFWSMQHKAVESIIAVYGLGWKVRAPFDETILATIPSKFRSYVTERGTRIKWGADHRLPAAQYWPGAKLPEGLELMQDYARHGAEPYGPQPAHSQHGDAWHLAHGYVQRERAARDGKMVWINELQAQAEDAREEALRINRDRREEERQLRELEQHYLGVVDDYSDDALHPANDDIWAEDEEMCFADAAD